MKIHFCDMCGEYLNAPIEFDGMGNHYAHCIKSLHFCDTCMAELLEKRRKAKEQWNDDDD